jgi:hypothetical protein
VTVPTAVATILALVGEHKAEYADPPASPGDIAVVTKE